MDRKESTRAAIHNFIRKEMNDRESREVPTRRNKAPERETETSVLKWCRSNGFSVHVVEASVYDRVTGSRGEAKAEAGFSDVVGNTALGLACYIELKAEGRRSTLSELQRRFLTSKIHQNCFAVVVDSEKRLAQYWKGFCSLKSPEQRVAYLLDCLPKLQPQKGKQRPIDEFEKKFGF